MIWKNQCSVGTLAATIAMALLALNCGAAAAAKDSPTIELRGAHDDRKISIKDGKFQVLIQNKTNVDINIWGEHCSWGWGIISFEVRSGKKTLKVDRDEINWKRNDLHLVSMLPHSRGFRDIKFDDRTWHWEKVSEFCKNNPGATITAKLTIKPDTLTKAQNVWVGSVESLKSFKLEM